MTEERRPPWEQLPPPSAWRSPSCWFTLLLAVCMLFLTFVWWLMLQSPINTCPFIYGKFTPGSGSFKLLEVEQISVVMGSFPCRASDNCYLFFALSECLTIRSKLSPTRLNAAVSGGKKASKAAAQLGCFFQPEVINCKLCARVPLTESGAFAAASVFRCFEYLNCLQKWLIINAVLWSYHKHSWILES